MNWIWRHSPDRNNVNNCFLTTLLNTCINVAQCCHIANEKVINISKRHLRSPLTLVEPFSIFKRTYFINSDTSAVINGKLIKTIPYAHKILNAISHRLKENFKNLWKIRHQKKFLCLILKSKTSISNELFIIKFLHKNSSMNVQQLSINC